MYVQEIKKFAIFLAVIGLAESCCDSDRLGKAIMNNIPRMIAGIPEYGCKVLDPMCLNEICIDIGGLNMSCSGAVLHGLKEAPVEYVKVDFECNTIYIKLANWNSYYKAKYSSSGVILDDIPLCGDGDITIDPKGMDLYGEMKFKVECRDNKHHLIGNGFTYHFDINDHVEFTLSNLYGDEKRGCETVKTLNKRWREVKDCYSKPIMDAVTQAIYNNAASFFCAVSVEDLIANDSCKSDC